MCPVCSPAWVEACNRAITEGVEAKKAVIALVDAGERSALETRGLTIRIHQLEGALEWAIRHMKLKCPHGEACPVVAVAQENLGRVVEVKKRA